MDKTNYYSHKIDNIKYEDFKNICRVCISNFGMNFTKDSVILDIFHKLTDIHFETNEELPQQICLKCFDFINEIQAFSMACKRSHSALMECLNEYKNLGIKKEAEIIEETNEQIVTIDEQGIEFVKVEPDNNWEINDPLNEEITEITNDLLTPVSNNIQAKNDEESNNLLNTNDINQDIISSDSEYTTNTISVGNNNPSVPETSNNVQQRLHKCDQCDKSFTKSWSLKCHKRNMHSGERAYKCDQCDKSFLEFGALTKHKRVHSGEFPYKCDQCEKSFTQLGNLNVHKYVHSGEYPYKCDVCEKSFAHSGSLNNHKLVHSGEQLYKCDQCEVSFNQLGSLKYHKRVHSGELKYKCDQCEKSYAQSRSLKYHKQHVHNGECPFKCDQCSKSFTYASSLKVHKRVHSGERRPFKCDQCEKSFTQLGPLKYHKRVHNRDVK